MDWEPLDLVSSDYRHTLWQVSAALVVGGEPVTSAPAKAVEILDSVDEFIVAPYREVSVPKDNPAWPCVKNAKNELSV